jgi:hypothetical protein
VQYPPVRGAANAFHVTYTPKDRGRTVGAYEDRFVWMNIHWPKKEGTYPCIVLFHGGGVGGGDIDVRADSKGYEAILRGERYDKYQNGIGLCRIEDFAYFVKRGYVVAAVNHVLGKSNHTTIKRWDAKTAVRYLRANAAKYRIDPDAIFAYGSSSGVFLANTLRLGPEETIDVRVISDDQERRDKILVPADDPHPAFAEHSALIQGMVNDGNEHKIHPAAGAVLVIDHRGAQPHAELASKCEQSGLDFRAIELTEGNYNHLANFRWRSIVAGDATPKPVRERWADYMDYLFQDNPRTPSPEFRPNVRQFAGQTEISIVTTSGGMAVHYTLDGSTPTEASPVYEGPIRISETTTIKAFCSRDGERPSGMAMGRFTKVNREPPRIVGPDGPLPAATVGRPYSLEFQTAADQPVVWAMAGHLHRIVTRSGTIIQDEGFRFDPQTSVLSGTPLRPGTFTFQVFAASDAGGLADGRTYVLCVRAKETTP